MAIPTAYLTSVRNTKAILEDVQRAGVPERFTYEFLKQLGHASSTDRPVVSMLKALGFLTDSGQPTDRYRRFKDPSQAGGVMAEALRDAYADVFTVDQEAYKRNRGELKGIFARLSDKGESVNEKMAMTFKTLADLADFEALPVAPEAGDGELADQRAAAAVESVVAETEQESRIVVHHDVHIHLPATTDIKVYDGIFRSLRENLR